MTSDVCTTTTQRVPAAFVQRLPNVFQMSISLEHVRYSRFTNVAGSLGIDDKVHECRYSVASL